MPKEETMRPISSDEEGTEEVGASDAGRASWDSSVLPYLYGSHALSKWGDRMWEFAVGLFMIELWPDSLLLAAIYGLAEGLSITVFGVVVGNWVDRSPRLKVVKISLALQNAAIVLAGLALVVLLGSSRSSLPADSKAFISLVVLVNLCGGVAAIGGVATNIVVERDWVVVLAGRNQAPEMLAQMNSVMRRIDLSCKLLAPVVVGALMSGLSSLWCAVMIASWNVLSFGFEFWFLRSVYWFVSALQEERHSAGDLVDADSELVPLQGDSHWAEVAEVGASDNARPAPEKSKFVSGWKVYCQQDMVLAGISLALLYFTVLSFGWLMTAFLEWRGVPAFVLGLGRGFAALIGILATLVYPLIQPRLKTVRTGLWSIWIQWSLLSICATSLLVQNWVVASAMLIGGVSASRFGLWMFDLSVTQLMQEGVPDHERGTVGGVQTSLQSMMDLMSYVMAVIIPNPKTFWIAIIISYGSVGLAAALYASYSRRVRGHLFHFDHLLHKQ